MRRNVKYRMTLCDLVIVLAAIMGPGVPGAIPGPPAAHAVETPTYTYGWAPSPTADEQGNPLAPAVAYEVWVEREGEEPARVATVVADTTYTLECEAGETYRIRVCGVDELGRVSEPSPWSDPLVIPLVTGAPDALDLPPATAATLAPAYPNPFNPSTRLRYAVPEDLPAGAPVRLQILDVRGGRICELPVERTPGWHEVQWLGRDASGQSVASGVYLAQLVCGRQRSVTRLTLTK